MDVNSAVSCILVLFEVLLCVYFCLALKRYHQRSIEDSDLDDTTTNSTTEQGIDGHDGGGHTSAPPTRAAGTVLYTAPTTQQRRRQGNFASYFPPAEVGETVVEGSVIAQTGIDTAEVEKEEESDREAPYGKADYLHRSRSQMIISASSPTSPLH